MHLSGPQVFLFLKQPTLCSWERPKCQGMLRRLLKQLSLLFLVLLLQLQDLSLQLQDFHHVTSDTINIKHVIYNNLFPCLEMTSRQTRGMCNGLRLTLALGAWVTAGRFLEKD